MTAAESSITNCWDAGLPRTDLPAEHTFLYVPEGPEDWYYRHHPFLTHFAGRYYAMWSAGRENEDDVGQRVMYAVSEDFRDWSAPRVLAPSAMGRHNEVTRYAEGWWAFDGTLVAYFTQFEYEPDALVDGHRTPGDRRHMDTGLYALTSTDGEAWSAPIDLGLPVGPNYPPQPLASGRLLMTVSFTYPYTDDPTGLDGWKLAGLYPPEMEGRTVDDSEGIWKMKEIRGWPNVLCEGAFYQTDDEIIHMLLRSNTGRLWVTESRDNAESWSEPVPTAFTNNASKFHLGRLPDGRFYWVGNPDPKPKVGRSPLAVLVSADGVRFDRHFILADDRTLYDRRREGMHKGGQYGYPHTILVDDHLCVIVSRMKEAVEVYRTPLSALDD